MSTTSTKLSGGAHAVLGLLSRRPTSGYELGSLAERTIAHFWPIPDPAFRRVIGDAFVSALHAGYLGAGLALLTGTVLAVTLLRRAAPLQALGGGRHRRHRGDQPGARVRTAPVRRTWPPPG